MKQNMPTEIKELLNNDLFILWCLNPTKELDTRWNKWMKDNPKQAAYIEESKKLFFSIRLNDHRMPLDEANELRSRILNDLKKRQK